MIETAAPLTTWRVYRLVLVGLIVAAWLILMIWATTPYASLLDHHEIESATFPASVRWPAFVGGWTLMVLAMMLPGSLPMLKSYLRTVDGPTPGRLLGRFVLGYLLAWIAFGAAIYLGDTLLHGAVDRGLVQDAVADRIPFVLLLIAGLYQFTPLRQHCRSLAGLPPAPAGKGGAGALQGGVRAGLLCLGACGGPMLVMFGLAGGANLTWMAALAVFMTVERVTEARKFTAWALGVVLLLWAALQLAA